MDLQVNNYNEAVIEWCNTILKSHYNLSFLTKKNTEDTVRENRVLIDRNLIQMTLASQYLVGLVFSIPNAGEIHGLPREATQAADEPDVIVVDKEQPQKDFKSWYGEKSGILKDAVHRLMVYLELDYETKAASHMSKEEWEKFVGGMLRSNMREIEGKTNAILEMVESGRLVIKDVKVEE